MQPVSDKPVSHNGDVHGRRGGRGEGGGEAPANIPCGYIRSVHKRLESGHQRTLWADVVARPGRMKPKSIALTDIHPPAMLPHVAVVVSPCVL